MKLLRNLPCFTQNTTGHKVIVTLVMIGVISFFLEITLFNINHWLSCFLENPAQISESIVIADDSADTISFSELNRSIETITIQVEANNIVTVQYQISDDGSTELYSLPQTEVYSGNERSSTFRIHPYGDVKDLVVTFPGLNEPISVKSISVNQPVPFFFSIGRYIASFLFISFIVYLRPKSSWSRIIGVDSPVYRRASLVVLIIVLAVITMTCHIGSDDPNVPWYDGFAHNEYTELARSFAEGKVTLNEEPPDWLKQLDNPYDASLRNRIAEETGIGYKNDAAYYKGSYYVYFGVVPVVLFYLPYFLLTGNDLPNSIVTLFMALASTVVLWLLFRAIIRHYHPTISLSTFILSFLGSLGASYVVVVLGRPSFYSVPSMCGFAFVLIGLLLTVQSINDSNPSSRYAKLCFGSLAMGLVAGCRPQLLILSIPWAVILVKQIKTYYKAKKLKCMIRVIACVIVPLIAIAIPLMYYNFIRFESPLDFGANYNLAGNDMTLRGFDFVRAGEGVFYYLLQPPALTTSFPFLQPTAINTSFPGMTVSEPLIGGMLTCYPFVSVIPLLFLCRINDRKQKTIIFLFLILGFIVCVFDTEGAGLLPRYGLDFSLCFCFASTATAFSIETQEKNGDRSIPLHFAHLTLFYSVLIGIVMLVFQRFGIMSSAMGPTGMTWPADLWEYIRLSAQFWA
ncbi:MULTISPECIES: hypothetical protein [Bacteria]|uniref:hypothetical protein n=1 Tax=Bacteria TaxID=2 RepID=UPI001186C6AC|nr:MULTISPECIES: hypothetical protein [Bacteria]